MFIVYVYIKSLKKLNVKHMSKISSQKRGWCTWWGQMLWRQRERERGRGRDREKKKGTIG